MVLVGRFIVLLVLVKVMMSVWVAVGVLLGAFWGVGGVAQGGLKRHDGHDGAMMAPRWPS